MKKKSYMAFCRCISYTIFIEDMTKYCKDANSYEIYYMTTKAIKYNL
jgi:hypothetical protein